MIYITIIPALPPETLAYFIDNVPITSVIMAKPKTSSKS